MSALRKSTRKPGSQEPDAKPAAAKSFTARLEQMPSRLKWVIIRIPVDVKKVWGTRGQLKVSGEINDYVFRSSLFPTGKGTHILLVNKKMQAGAGVGPGDIAKFRLQPDGEERVVTAPRELTKAFSDAGDAGLRRWFEKLNYSTRKEIAEWVVEVKSAEARERRAQQMTERLIFAMEGETDLPPVLKAAFSRDLRAHAGWERMSPSQRRGCLLAIFYYQTPEARERRTAKVVEECAKFAERVGRA